MTAIPPYIVVAMSTRMSVFAPPRSGYGSSIHVKPYYRMC